MKCVVVLFAVVVACGSASLITTLSAIHNSPAFHNLSHQEQIIMIELMAEANAGELNVYIERIGFVKVLSVIDNLPEREAHLLTQALMKELTIEENNLTTTKAPVQAVGRRNLVDLMHQVVNSDSYKHLSPEDQNTLVEILKAAENHTLNALIDHLGYSTVLTLLDDLTDHDAHRLSTYISQHLKQEATTGSGH